MERARRIREARVQARFTAEQCVKQLKRGGRVLVEHPWSSKLWKYEPMVPLVRKLGKTRVDMCAYGVQCPGDANVMQKATGLLLSHQDLKDQCRVCPKNHVHQVIEGSSPEGIPRSTYAGKYTSTFVRAFLKPVLHEASDHLCCSQRMATTGSISTPMSALPDLPALVATPPQSQRLALMSPVLKRH